MPKPIHGMRTLLGNFAQLSGEVAAEAAVAVKAEAPEPSLKRKLDATGAGEGEDAPAPPRRSARRG